MLNEKAREIGKREQGQAGWTLQDFCILNGEGCIEIMGAVTIADVDSAYCGRKGILQDRHCVHEQQNVDLVEKTWCRFMETNMHLLTAVALPLRSGRCSMVE